MGGDGHRRIEALFVREDDAVSTVVGVIDRGRQGIALVVDPDGRLVGTITDGDVRRLLLRGGSLDEPASAVMTRRFRSVAAGTEREQVLAQLRLHMLRHMPVLDEAGRPVDLLSLGDLLPAREESRTAVIMAGGEGRRLRPITESIPKPLVEVGGRPILETQIEALAQAGFRRVILAVNYLAERIEAHFGNGARFGVEIEYLREPAKLGTAGALSLLDEPPPGPLLVMNGDVVTRVDFNALFMFHHDRRCAMTVGATRYELRIPLGVLRLAGPFLAGIDEKPTEAYLCNAGIYVLEPAVLPLVPRGEPYDMTDLMHKLVDRGLPIAVFPVREHWIDIGRPDDLERARVAMSEDGAEG